MPHEKIRIVVAGPDRAFAETLRGLGEARGWRVSCLEDLEPALALVRHGAAELLVADAGDGADPARMAGLREALDEGERSGAPVIVCGDGDGALDLRRAAAGRAADVWVRPLAWSEIPTRIEIALARLAPADAAARAERPLGMVRGRSAAFQAVLEQIELVANRDTTVLITGETGVGKECVARALHNASRRASGELVAVNCGGIPANLLEDEFFGHVRGAFTDAGQGRAGRFEQAHRGTLFLDEIGELPLDLQPKLLRALQERVVCRIGASAPVRTDARIVAATNVDLWERVQSGAFREDLFYRINVFPIHVPPLRERREDIPELIEHFAAKFCDRDGLPRKAVDSHTAFELSRRDWPGNIRELENAVEMAVIRSRDRGYLTLHDFPPERRPAGRSEAAEAGFQARVAGFERALIERALASAGGNKTQAAESLGIKRTTLLEKLKRIEREQRLVAAG